MAEARSARIPRIPARRASTACGAERRTGRDARPRTPCRRTRTPRCAGVARGRTRRSDLLRSWTNDVLRGPACQQQSITIGSPAPSRQHQPHATPRRGRAVRRRAEPGSTPGATEPALRVAAPRETERRRGRSSVWSTPPKRPKRPSRSQSDRAARCSRMMWSRSQIDRACRARATLSRSKSNRAASSAPL